MSKLPTKTICDGGIEQWTVKGKLHREDGPALIFADGGSYWYLNGLLHRENGPAIEFLNGHREWYLRGICIKVVRAVK